MNTPTISQYAESVCHPYGRFRTLGEPAVERDAYGEPLLYAGGNAAVFKVWLAGRPYALKCYTRPGKRNGMLYAYLAARRTPLLCEVRYLPEELYIYGPDGEGAWYDTVLTEWADGDSLGYAVRRALHHRDTERMAALSRGFDAMVAALLSMPWAHGDLKPGNITVGTDGTMRLLDYDAMYIPGIDAPGAPETGTPQFNHPSRNASFFSKSIDDYPAALISAALRTLAPDLSFAVGADLTDSLLFTPPELFARRSERYAKALTEAARRGDAVTYRLLTLLLSPTPALPSLGGIIRFATDGNDALPAGNTAPEPFLRNGAWGYETAGHETVPPLFDTALRFTEGLAVVETGGFRHFIDPTGHTAIVGSGYDHLKPFRSGVAAVRRAGRWSCIDRQGNPVESPSDNGRTGIPEAGGEENR